MKRLLLLVVVAIGLSAHAACPDLDPAKFWNAAELFQAPEYRANPYPESDYAGLKAMLVKGKGPKGTQAEFFAYYAHPEGKAPNGGWPGMVLVHGGGGTAYPQYVQQFVRDGFAVIALDWYNRRPAMGLTNEAPTQVNVPRVALEGGKRQDHVANVANIVLAHSLLRSFSEVNAGNTVYVGLSWGSWYGSCVTAVDDRFRGGVMIYLCNRVQNGTDDPTKETFVKGPFHKSIKVPLWWIVWPRDPNGTPASMQAGWEACPKAMFRGDTIIENLGHSHAGFEVLAVRRMAKYFAGMDRRVPLLSCGEAKDGVFSAIIEDAGLGVSSAKLWYTEGALSEREKLKWQSIPATIDGKRISAKLPKDATMAYLSVYEENQPDSNRKVYSGSSRFYIKR